MPSNFPGAIDSFTDPLSNSSLASPSHSTLHSDINDAVEKVETYMGLVKVIPTGATNGTVGATGTVTIGNAVSSVTVTNAFSSLYDNYRILLTNVAVSTTATIRFQLVTSGGTTAASSYGLSGFYQNTTTLTGIWDLAGTFFDFALATTASKGTGVLEVMSPFAADYTRFEVKNMSPSIAIQYVGVHQAATSYPSFILTTSAGTMTGGTIRVYGYRN